MFRWFKVRRALKELNSSDATVRKNAAEALSDLGDTRVVEPLIVKLSDKDWKVRAAAVKALGQIGDVRAMEPLIAQLSDESSGSCYVREAAAEALAKIGIDKLPPPQRAIYFVHTGNPAEAAKLGECAVKPLIAKLSDEDWKVRNAAAEALGQSGDVRAMEPLIAMLDRGNCTVAAKAVARIGVEKLTLPRRVAYFLQTRNPEEAAMIGECAVEPLIANLRNRSGYFRKAAAEALTKIGIEKLTPQQKAVYFVHAGKPDEAAKLGECAVEPLSEFITKKPDNDWDSRWKAAVALIAVLSQHPGLKFANTATVFKAICTRHGDKNTCIGSAHDCSEAVFDHTDAGIGVDIPTDLAGRDF